MVGNRLWGESHTAAEVLACTRKGMDMTAKPRQDDRSAAEPPAPEAAALAFVESLRVPVVFLDRAGKLRYMNGAAQRLLGQGLPARLEEHLRTRPEKAKISQVILVCPFMEGVSLAQAGGCEGFPES